MATTDGANTHVVAVQGNFDDCQTGVKWLFANENLNAVLDRHGYLFSSANSINWGRLCPQIVYYYRAYQVLLSRGTISPGDKVDFCVPTGNFGNILAAYYAKRMGLPVRRLICASNKNRILYDFFTSGIYDANREFFKTMSPSMDILISSNLERFLFEITGHDSERINRWYGELMEQGRFEVDSETKAALQNEIVPGWVDEPSVLDTIGTTFKRTGYVLDPHTSVAVTVSERTIDTTIQTVIDSTASPYKFSGNVLKGLSGATVEDEFDSIDRIHTLSKFPLHTALAGLKEKPIRHNRTITVDQMEQTVLSLLNREKKTEPS
jgi:threonine synthase